MNEYETSDSAKLAEQLLTGHSKPIVKMRDVRVVVSTRQPLRELERFARLERFGERREIVAFDAHSALFYEVAAPICLFS